MGKLKVVQVGSDLHGEDLRSEILKLKQSIDTDRWELAGHLMHVHDDMLYQRWGHMSFEDYVETEVGLTSRTARYLVSMYTWFVHKLGPKMSDGDREDMLAEVKDVGWTKARSLIKVTTPENVGQWLKRAKGMSTSDLEDVVRREYHKSNGGEEDELDKMKGLNFGKVFEEQHDIVMQALSLAEKQADSDKKGHLISLVCQDFVASNMAQTEKGQTDRGKYFNKIAAQFGVRLIAVDIESGKVVHGKREFEKLLQRERDGGK